MRAVDTNVLVRLITRDDEKQAESADAFVSSGAWVSHLVLAETIWVLESVYDLDATQIATTVAMLLNHEHLTIQDGDVVAAALGSLRKRPTVSLTDRLILEVARKNGHVPLGTFDRNLGKLDGVERLSP
jgi:predicted nucleic-acid-binding protein